MSHMLGHGRSPSYSRTTIKKGVGSDVRDMKIQSTCLLQIVGSNHKLSVLLGQDHV